MREYVNVGSKIYYSYMNEFLGPHKMFLSLALLDGEGGGGEGGGDGGGGDGGGEGGGDGGRGDGGGEGFCPIDKCGA